MVCTSLLGFDLACTIHVCVYSDAGYRYTYITSGILMKRSCVLFIVLVTQLQTTLAAVQELLLQHQQKIQELTQELAASKVRSDSPSTAHYELPHQSSYKYVDVQHDCKLLWVKLCHGSVTMFSHVIIAARSLATPFFEMSKTLGEDLLSQAFLPKSRGVETRHKEAFSYICA